MSFTFKPLCLSFWTPPTVRPQAILIGKMIPEWIRQGTKPIIVNYANQGHWNTDLSTTHIPQWKINKYVATLPWLPKLLKKKYYKNVFEQLSLIIEREEPAVIFSFANPQESNVLGGRLKERFGIPFVSHFSDPWYDNPYSTWTERDRAEILKLERFIVTQSDRIVFVNEELRDLVMKKFPSEWKNKTVIIPHCFDAKEYPSRQTTSAKIFKFSHIGAFYKQRTPELLCTALAELLLTFPELRGKFELELVGAAGTYTTYTENSLRELLLKYNLIEYTKIFSAVSYEESLRYMKNTDCLVVIDANIPDSPFLPSKVVDYAGSTTPILGITPSESPTSRFLKELGQKTFTYEEKEQLKDYIKNILAGKSTPEYNQTVRARYTVQNTTAQLLNIFKELTSSV